MTATTTTVTPQSVLGVIINCDNVAITFLLSDGTVEQAIVRGSNFNLARLLAKRVYAGENSPELTQELFKLTDLEKALSTFCVGKVVVSRGKVFYDNEELHDAIVDKILAFYQAGDSFEPLAKFLDKLFGNPSARATKEFYNFTVHVGMAIAPDGDVYGYKAVRNDYTDKHSGKFSNKPGTTLEMPRNKVDDDANIGCSYGFHVGSFEYANGFGCNYGDETGDRLLLIKFNPADVVSVPHDCSHQKVRVCKYTVVGELKNRDSIKDHLLNEQAAKSYVNNDTLSKVSIFDLDELLNRLS